MNLGETIRHNLGLKALSLFLAVVLWLYVAMARETETSRSVPVLLRNIPTGLIVEGKPPSTIDIRMKGPKILMMMSHTDPPALVLDLKGAKEGTTVFPSPDALINLPEGVRVTRVVPASIEVRLLKRMM